MGNKSAAMPSLHAGIAFLIVFYAIWRLSTRWRWLLLLYPIAMSTALVYFAEHYVIDVVDAGPLGEGRRFDRDQPAYGAELAAEPMRAALAQADVAA